MRLLLSILLSVMTIYAHAQDIESFVHQQLTCYPQSRLLDIYKSCFQDFMGAEHLVSNKERVASYMERELEQIETEGLQTWYYEPCGTEGRFVRVSLLAVKDEKISKEALLDAFIRSANAKRRPVSLWKKTWNKYIRKIDRMELNLKNYDDDKAFIDSVLQTGDYAISHSPEYRGAYHPHYRIIERSIFEKELKPLLESKDGGKTVIVYYDSSVGAAAIEDFIKKNNIEVLYRYNNINGCALKLKCDKQRSALEKTKGVLSVQDDRKLQLD